MCPLDLHHLRVPLCPRRLDGHFADPPEVIRADNAALVDVAEQIEVVELGPNALAAPEMLRQDLSLEFGLVAPEGLQTDLGLFVADSDPSTTTNPLLVDTDGGTASDGDEDANIFSVIILSQTARSKNSISGEIL